MPWQACCISCAIYWVEIYLRKGWKLWFLVLTEKWNSEKRDCPRTLMLGQGGIGVGLCTEVFEVGLVLHLESC